MKLFGMSDWARYDPGHANIAVIGWNPHGDDEEVVADLLPVVRHDFGIVRVKRHGPVPDPRHSLVEDVGYLPVAAARSQALHSASDEGEVGLVVVQL